MKLEFPTFRRAFLTGMVVLAPLVVTGWVFIALFRFIDGRIRPVLMRIPAVDTYLPEEGVVGIGFLAAVLVVMLVGLLSNNLIGRAFFGAIDSILNRIPWTKGIYNASKELAGVVFSDRSRAFRRVVLFEYPRAGLYSLAFVTNELEREGHEDLLHLFLPTTPNPTSGYFLMVPRRDAIALPITIEDGLKLIVSGGAVISDANRARLEEAVAQIREPDRTPAHPD